MVLNPGGSAESDGWSRDCGLDDWSWEKVAPAYTRVEKDSEVREVEALGCMPNVNGTAKIIGLSSGYSHCGSSMLTTYLTTSAINARKDRLTIYTGVVAIRLFFQLAAEGSLVFISGQLEERQRFLLELVGR